jgi:hypothetical protein
VSNIVPFGRKREDDGSRTLWICSCGCSSFQLRADGWAECARCEAVQNGVSQGEWFERLRCVPDEVEPQPDNSEKIVRFNTSEAALAHVLSRATPSVAAFVIVLHRDGSISCWGDEIEDEKDRAWFDARVAEAAELRTVKKDPA